MRRPLNLRVVDFSFKTMSLTWNPPNITDLTDILNYRVYYHLAGLSSDGEMIGMIGLLTFNLIAILSSVIYLSPFNSFAGPWLHQRDLPGNITEFLLKGLQPGTKYSVFVAANFSEGMESRSAIITHQTKGFGGIDNR